MLTDKSISSMLLSPKEQFNTCLLQAKLKETCICHPKNSQNDIKYKVQDNVTSKFRRVLNCSLGDNNIGEI